MKSILAFVATVLAAGIALLVHPGVRAAQSSTDATDLVRGIYKTDRQTFVAESLPLTDRESAAFWPLYRSYRSEMDKLGDSLVKLVLAYRDVYPNVSDDRARQLLRDYADLEEKIVSTRARYLHRVAKDVSPTKALRWAQLENRMDLALRMQVAEIVPVVGSTPTQP